jgi:hypothetical protein
VKINSPRVQVRDKGCSTVPARIIGTKAVLISLALTTFLISAHRLPAPVFELAEKLPQTSGVSVNQDGSRTAFDIDRLHRKATALVTDRDGKLREKVEYELDAAGRITAKTVFDAIGNFREKTSFRYDKTGRVIEQTQAGKDDTLLSRIAYEYDPQTGKQSGHSIYDGNGRLVNQSPAAGKTPRPPPPREAQKPQRAFESGIPGN